MGGEKFGVVAKNAKKVKTNDDENMAVENSNEDDVAERPNTTLTTKLTKEQRRDFGVSSTVERNFRTYAEESGAEINNDAIIFMASTLTYITAEWLQLAGDAVENNQRKTITPRYLQIAMRGNDQLNELIKNVICNSAEVPTDSIAMQKKAVKDKLTISNKVVVVGNSKRVAESGANSISSEEDISENEEQLLPIKKRTENNTREKDRVNKTKPRCRGFGEFLQVCNNDAVQKYTATGSKNGFALCKRCESQRVAFRRQ